MPDDTNPAANLAAHTHQLPIGAIALSSTHVQALRRKRYKPEAIAELADSFRRLGQLQPIVARPYPGRRPNDRSADPHFEIVAGERRYLAAQQAGMETIEASVRNLDDAQVIEAQVTENLQREDLHPMEEAEGYEELRKAAGLSIDELIIRVGKSRSWVFGRLKLLDLAKPAREAFLAGEINASVALELARITNEKLQGEALEAIRDETADYDAQPSVRRVQDLIRQEFLLRLAQAPFPLDDAELVQRAGACTACPKRSGNQPELWAADSADLCTDGACFKAKREAHIARLLEQAKTAGQVVISGKAAKKIKSHESGGLRGYQALDKPTYTVPGNKSLRQLLQPDPPPAVLLQDPFSGEVIEVLRDDEVARQLKKRGYLDSKGKRARDNDERQDDYKRETRDREAKARLENETRRTTWLRLREKLAAGAATLEDWRMVAEAFYKDIWHEHQKRLCKQWGWEHKGEIAKPLAGLNAEQVALFLMDCALVTDTHVGPWDSGKAERLGAAAKRHGIDVAEIRKMISAEKKVKAG